MCSIGYLCKMCVYLLNRAEYNKFFIALIGDIRKITKEYHNPQVPVTRLHVDIARDLTVMKYQK